MKKILMFFLLLLSVGVIAQERKEYEQVDETTIMVTVYYDDILTQKGTMRLHDGKWVPCGTWTGYNREGDIIMTAEFKGGKKLRFKALTENYIVMIEPRKEEKAIQK